MDCAVIIHMSDEVAKVVNHVKSNGIHLEDVPDCYELNNSNFQLHNHINSRVFITQGVSAGRVCKVVLYNQIDKEVKFTIPNDKEYVEVEFKET